MERRFGLCRRVRPVHTPAVDPDFEAWVVDEPPGTRALRAVWWNEWVRAREGDERARTALLERVALQARADGETGLPASRTLDPWLRLSPGLARDNDWHLQASLLRTAADAHALGAVVRRDRQARLEAARAVPVVRLSSRIVAAFLSGDLDGPALDHVLDRLFRQTVALRATWAVIDVSNLDPVPEVLVESLKGISGVGLPEALEVAVCGGGLDSIDLGSRVCSRPTLADLLVECRGA